MQRFDNLAKMVDCGSHFSAHWILNGGPNIESFLKQVEQNNENNEVQEAGWKKHDSFIDFLCQNRRPDIVKTGFRIIHVAKYVFSGSCETYRKLMPKEASQTIQIDHFRSILSFFLRFCSVLEQK